LLHLIGNRGAMSANAHEVGRSTATHSKLRRCTRIKKHVPLVPHNLCAVKLRQIEGEDCAAAIVSTFYLVVISSDFSAPKQ
jgi:hypothetical protein